MEKTKNTLITALPCEVVQTWSAVHPTIPVSLKLYQMTEVMAACKEENDELSVDQYDAIDLGHVSGTLFASARDVQLQRQSMISPDEIGVPIVDTTIPWFSDKSTLLISEANIHDHYDEVIQQLPVICAQLYRIYPNRIIVLKPPSDMMGKS